RPRASKADDLRDKASARSAGQANDDLVDYAEFWKQCEILERSRDAEARKPRSWGARENPLADPYDATVRWIAAADDIDQRALASAVWPDDGVDIALPYREIEIGQGLHATERKRDIDERQRWLRTCVSDVTRESSPCCRLEGCAKHHPLQFSTRTMRKASRLYGSDRHTLTFRLQLAHDRNYVLAEMFDFLLEMEEAKQDK